MEAHVAFQKHLAEPEEKRFPPRPEVQADMPNIKNAEAEDAYDEHRASSGEWVPEERGLHHARKWYELTLFKNGARTKGCQTMPKTCQILEAALPEACRFSKGSTRIQAMEPGTHAAPHTSASNIRLQLHLG